MQTSRIHLSWVCGGARFVAVQPDLEYAHVKFFSGLLSCALVTFAHLERSEQGEDFLSMQCLLVNAFAAARQSLLFSMHSFQATEVLMPGLGYCHHNAR